MEEEQEDDEDGDIYQDAVVNEDEEPPLYSRPAKNSGMELRSNGYAIDKKAGPLTSDDDHDDGGNVSRRLSQRQLEKAAEGRPPRSHPGDAYDHSHAHANEDFEGDGKEASSGAPGPAPVESKFTEEL
ncbi:hypothetical protein BU15DRAFT_69418 [Melanogaster broomeanus]|nr:hypothetical protein BU15DRAFT_69418 [Melanogaster broomeanus]